MAKTDPSRREFLQLAHKYKPGDNISEWYISEKLDGTRCFWDGGMTRGKPTQSVPWANVLDPKTGKPKKKLKPISTGLWSRYGNPIIAPDAFLDSLPCCLLDGELWAGRGNFQLCRSICGGDDPDPRFLRHIRYMIYSSPSLEAVFQTGLIKISNMLCHIDFDACKKVMGDINAVPAGSTFEDELQAISDLDDFYYAAHGQIQLSYNQAEAEFELQKFMDDVLSLGGEGVVLRDPYSVWLPKRNHGILKYKPYSDAEAVITGFTSGRETDKGSKHLGKIGALITNYSGKRLELSGLLDVEREFATEDMRDFATNNPGIDMPQDFVGAVFKVGQTVTFKYRELSDDHIPKEARYWRRRDEE